MARVHLLVLRVHTNISGVPIPGGVEVDSNHLQMDSGGGLLATWRSYLVTWRCYLVIWRWNIAKWRWNIAN